MAAAWSHDTETAALADFGAAANGKVRTTQGGGVDLLSSGLVLK